METVTYWERNNGQLIMTFRKLDEWEKKYFKRSVEEILEMSEILKLWRVPWARIDGLILSKLDIN